MTVETPCLRTRPIASGDREALLEAFERLSPETRYLRFAMAKPRLTQGELTYLVEVDHGTHEALVAVICETLDPVGIARYVVTGSPGGTAEIAVVVADDWQGRGIGPRLLAALVDRAREEGIVTLRADVLAENRRARRVLERHGFTAVGATGLLVAYERSVAP